MALLPDLAMNISRFLFLKKRGSAVFALVLLLGVQPVLAQSVIKGTVTDQNNKPLPYAVVSLYKGKASISTLTDSAGQYRVKPLPKGEYKIVFSYVSYSDSSMMISLNTDTLINIQFQGSKKLEEAVVRARRPVIQMQIDRIRFNVAGTDLVFGNNIWDVIEKTPMVSASSDGSIQIRGTTGAVVYINNKRKILSGSELKAYLSSIPAENLVAVEVITTPSSRYDAEGGAGILNIITKKKKEDGVEGNANINARQTKVNSQAGSVYLNAHQGKWNVYTSLYTVNRNREPDAKQDIFFPNPITGTLNSRQIRTLSHTKTFSYGGNAGIDYEIGKDRALSLLLDYAGTKDNKDRTASSFDDYLGVEDSTTLSGNTDRLRTHTYSLNINYEGRLGASGKRMSIDYDALKYTSTNNSVSQTDVLSNLVDGILYTRDLFRSAAPQEVTSQSLKTDFQWPVNTKTSIDFGLKGSVSEIDNSILFENNNGGNNWTKDNRRSNLFRYDENIYSGYFILHHTISKKWAYQLGIRLENTVAKGYLEGIRVVDRNYINAFPTGFLKYSPAEGKTYTLSFSSRITRPSYWDVNPFRTYTTDQAYFEGNPFLQPSRFYRQELGHSFDTKKGNCVFQLAASQTLNEFYSLPYNDSADILVNKKTNYGNKYSYSANVVYYAEPTSWWRLTATALAGYVISKGGYAGIPIDNETTVFSLSANQSFTLSKKKGWSCTVIATNTLPYTIVNTRVADRFETELRIRKTAGAFNITLSGTDFFQSNRDRYRVRANDLRINQDFYYDLRSVALSVSYNFGKSTVKSKRDRDAEFENVKGRIN